MITFVIKKMITKVIISDVLVVMLVIMLAERLFIHRPHYEEKLYLSGEKENNRGK